MAHSSGLALVGNSLPPADHASLARSRPAAVAVRSPSRSFPSRPPIQLPAQFGSIETVGKPPVFPSFVLLPAPVPLPCSSPASASRQMHLAAPWTPGTTLVTEWSPGGADCNVEDETHRAIFVRYRALKVTPQPPPSRLPGSLRTAGNQLKLDVRRESRSSRAKIPVCALGICPFFSGMKPPRLTGSIAIPHLGLHRKVR